jgi:hypothetical protein
VSAGRHPQPRVRRRAPSPGDWILLVLLLAAVPLARSAGKAPAGVTRITVRSAQSPDLFLDPGRDTTLAVAGPLGATQVQVHAREVWIAASPCRNQLCVRMGRVRAPGRALVCLPNRVLVRFAGNARTPAVDAITR